MNGILFRPTITDKLCYCLRKYEDESRILPLLEAGADVNGTDSKGNSPLMLACLYPTCDIAKLLIDWGADVNHRDPTNGMTVVHFAVYKRWLKLLKAVVKKGANLDVKNHIGSVPLALAANSKNKDAAEILITYGANACYLDSWEWTMLHLASHLGWLNVVQACLKRNMGIDSQNGLGNTPLRLACDDNHLELVEYLLKAGADCRVKNFCGVTPFDFMIHKYYVEPIKTCIENGAYIKPEEYDVFLQEMMLKDHVLGDVEACHQSIVNKFNSKDLPDLYQIPWCAANLPAIGDLKIAKSSEMAQDVKRAAALEKQAKGYVNFKEVRPIVLRMMCVQSFLGYHQTVVKGGEVLEKMKV